MDFDGDGILDIISGSYDPGDIFLIRGEGRGAYAKIQEILDEERVPLVHHPVERKRIVDFIAGGGDAYSEKILNERVASFGSWPATVDWEGDGDLDMLIGSFDGQLFLRRNEGTRKAPIFGSECKLVEADGKPLKLHGHAAPAVGDWDGDGLWDLVLGSDTGAVGWCRNVGTLAAPSFGPFQELLKAPAEDKFLSQALDAGESPRPGVRAQVCLLDFNQDGRLDLLVGDYSEIKLNRQLSDEEKAEQGALLKRIEEIAAELRSLEQSEENKEKGEKLVAEYQAAEERTKSFYEEIRTSSYLWLYVRKPKAAAGPEGLQLAAPFATESAEELDDPVKFEGRGEFIESLNPNQRKYLVNLEVDIGQGWHLYDVASEANPTQVLEVTLDPVDGVEQIGQWTRPKGIPDLKHRGARLYLDQVTLSREIIVTGDQLPRELTAVIKYQVCNERFCRPIAKEKVVIKLAPR